MRRGDFLHGRSCDGPSVIAARKSLYVNGRFRVLALLKEREVKRRKAQLGNGRGVFPGSPGNRGTRQRLSALHRGVLRPWSALPGTWLLAAISRHPPVPVQPASVADPLGPDGYPGPPANEEPR